jgi:uncharacterized protein (DUF1800 family)
VYVAASFVVSGPIRSATEGTGDVREPIAQSDGRVEFAASSQRVWLGRTQMISFGADRASEKTVFRASIEPASAAEIVEPPTLLAGEEMGFLRLRGLAKGRATLRVGSTKLEIEVAPDAVANVSRAKLTSPANGAHVWGKVSVSAEMPVLQPESRRGLAARLRLPDGSELDPIATTDGGAHRHFAFEIDADQMPPGVTRLAVATIAGDQVSEPGDPLYVMVTRPDPSLMITGDCAAVVDGPRPERFGDRPPRIVKNAKAPGGAYVANPGPNPAWCLPVEVREAGDYQLFLTARGTFVAGAFPSVGVIVDEEERPRTASRLVRSDWHRTPIGRPVRLEAGSHVLTARYLNDFGVGRTDRNLHLSGYEIVRVDSGAPAGAEAPEPATIMSSDDASMTAAAPAMMMTDAGTGGDEAGIASPGSDSLRVAFDRIFDGRMVAGLPTIRARTWQSGGGRGRAPTVELLLNGAPVQSQQGTEVVFRVPPEALRRGENRVQLRATSVDEVTVLSPEQRLFAVGANDGAARAPRFRRYTVEDAVWDASLGQRLDGSRPPTAAFFSNGESFMELPADLAGAFVVRLEARGQAFRGAPQLEVLVRRPDQQDQSLGLLGFAGGWRTKELRAAFEPGPKQLVVRYVNDLAAKADSQKKKPGGDRNVFLKAVQIEEVLARKVGPPLVTVLYPKPNQVVGSADAVVVEVSAGSELALVDLLIDGKPQQLDLAPEDGIGPVLLPLLTRSLVPGRHSIQVVAEDVGKRRAESNPVEIVVNTSNGAVGGTYARAIHLLNRFAYGPEPTELADLLTLGEEAWLRRRLSEPADSLANQTLAGALAVTHPDERDDRQVVPRVLRELLTTANPVRARFVLWAENHFSTWLQKAGAQNKRLEHLGFDQLGPAPFYHLLMASATSPAMLVYLDQRTSFAGRLNENYARELMELHTVGVHGGYTQSDVTELARQLNGWTISEEASATGSGYPLDRTFRFEPRVNDGASRRIMAIEFPAAEPEGRFDNTLRALEMLAAHPSTARFISEKLALHYAGDPAPRKLVDDLAVVYHETGGDVAVMLTALARHPEFWKAAPKIATPLDFGVRFSRACGAANAGAVNDFLKRSGMGLFDRPSPDGYPEGNADYSDSNALLQRWRFSRAVQGSMDRLAPKAWALAPKQEIDPDRAQRLVDMVAFRLTGRVLGAASNEAALRYLREAADAEPDRVRLATTFVSQTPEMSLR